VVGAILSLLVVVFLFERRRPGSRLGSLVERLTNRDFAWLVLMLAVVDRLDLFLWMAAVGSHAFWILATVASITGRARSQAG
jgi:hypothetical protein